ncbi:MAG: hypothetical protein OEL83_17965 [Desulforhopalus sp.]|nr:hypothetical protein [Desulforhopalus sp.]
MYNQAFQLNQTFVQELFDRINGSKEVIVPNSALSDMFLRGNIPSPEHLAELLNIAHWASFSTEEGYSVTASLILRKPDHTADTFYFDTPIDLTARTLVKLGPALENPQADIGVWPDDKGQLKIWGFTAISYEMVIKSDLWIQILGPGRILIMYSGRTVAAVTANRAVFIDSRSFLHSIMPKIAAQAQNTDISLLNLFRYNSILKIAQQMRNHGRGGTVLIVPADMNWKNSITAPIQYTGGASFLDADAVMTPPTRTDLADSENLLRIVKEMNLNLHKDWLRNWQQVQQQCARIARLTSVDGALVMNFDRYVYCFGAKIEAIDTRILATNLRVIEPFEGHEPTARPFSSLGGTRHISAAQFAFDQPGAISIVASQDGNVTFFTRDSETGGILSVQQAEMALLHEGLGGSLWNLSLFSEMGWLEKGVSKNEKGYLAGIVRWMRNTFQKDK